METNNPIWFIFLKQLLNICLKQLTRMISKMAAILIALMGKRCKHFLGVLLYPVMGLCILLLLVIAGREAYTRFCGHTAMPAHALKTTEGIDCDEVASLDVPAGYPPVETKLPDGTRVQLNAGSSLRWPAFFSADKRQVELQGEAYFEVAPDAQRIFIVSSSRLTVKAVGTCFNVNSWEDNEKSFVSLLEGSALITSKGKEKGLSPGQTAILHHNSGQLSTAPCDKRLVLAWPTGMHFFAGESLANICKTVSRLYGQKIIIDGQAGSKRFSGAINRQQPLQHFLSYIKETGGVEHYYDGKGQLHLK